MDWKSKFILILSFCFVVGTTSADNLKRKYFNEYTEEPDYYSDLTSIDNNLLPAITDTYDVGSSSLGWQDAYFTGTGTFDKLSLTNTTNSFDDISFANPAFYWLSTYTPTPSDIKWGIAANDGNNVWFAMIADGGAEGFGEPTIELRANFSDTTSVMRSDGAPWDIHADDFDDFVRFQTLSNIPEITTAGATPPDLKINAGSGEITSTSNFTTSGTITSGDITIFDATPILVFQDSNSAGAASVGFIEWKDSGGGRAGFLGNNSSGNDDLYWKNEQGGNIGIETTGAGNLNIIATLAQFNATPITTTGNIGADDATFTGTLFGTSPFKLYVDGSLVHTWTVTDVAATYYLLLDDGASHLLLDDGVSKLLIR